MNIEAFANQMYQELMQVFDQINSAYKAGDLPLFYRLKNQAILLRIQEQRKMLSFCIVHEGVQRKLVQLKPFEEAAKNRMDFLNPFIREKIEEDFDLVDEILSKIAIKMQSILKFREEHSIKLDHGCLYPVNDQTACHNPGCQKVKFFNELKKCSRCKSVMYCGQDCQKKDWASHKIVCKAPNK